MDLVDDRVSLRFSHILLLYFTNQKTLMAHLIIEVYGVS
jgi:hypothetical protein